MRLGVLCHASCGGSARVAIQLASGLARRGHQVHVFARSVPFGWPSDPVGAVVHPLLPEADRPQSPTQLHTDWPDAELQLFMSRLASVCLAERVELLHFHYAIPFASMAAKIRLALGDKPLLVGTLHGTDVTIAEHDWLERNRLKEALSLVDAITTVSQAHASLATRLLGLPATPQVIPNPVDLSRFQPNADRSADLLGESGELRRPRIVHMSNFRAVKDPLAVGRIFRLISRTIDAEMWLVGDGDGLEPLRRWLRLWGLEQHVRFYGVQPDVAPFLAGADLLLMTSLYESFCLAALEAMACGTPVVASAVGGLPEVVEHGVTGYLYPVGSYLLAADHAVALLMDKDKHLQMRRASVARAKLFAEEPVVEQYENLFSKLLTSTNLNLRRAAVAAT